MAKLYAGPLYLPVNDIILLGHGSWMFVGSCCNIPHVDFGGMFRVVFYSSFYVLLLNVADYSVICVN